MLVKHDSCRFNDTESFLYTFSCNVDIIECIIVIGKGIRPISMLILSYHIVSLVFTLNIRRGHIQVSVGVLLHPCLKKALLK